MTSYEEFFSRFKRPIVSGKLKYMRPIAPDIQQMPLQRFLRVLNRWIKPFEITHRPYIKKYDVLLMTDDKSILHRRLIKEAQLHGIPSVVVQHGYPMHKHAFLPLMADYLVCWNESLETFRRWGVQDERLVILRPQVPTVHKVTGISSIMFLTPPAEVGNPRHYYNGFYPNYKASKLVEYVNKIKAADPEVCIKPHPRGLKVMKVLLKDQDLVDLLADDLIHSATRIYSFKNCTTVKDCEVQGKKAIIVDGA